MISVIQKLGTRLLTPLRFVGVCLLTVVLLVGDSYAQADATYPLEPVDTSSPRATLTSFLDEIEDTSRLFRDEYWDAPSFEVYTRIINKLARILRTMDLSQIAPSARIEVGHEAATLLYEILARIELPPMDVIPNATNFENTEGPAKWTIPHTDITIARITEGTRKGEFLFSAATVQRVHEFYQRTQELPYLREVPIEDTARLRRLHGGWWVAMATIERLPA